MEPLFYRGVSLVRYSFAQYGGSGNNGKNKIDEEKLIAGTQQAL
jgi:hypothetical protein